MTNRPPSRDGATTGRAEWGSDVVVEMMQAYHIDYAPTNLGATFRGLLDSLVTFGENNPEVIECLHEEIAVSIAHGYARVTDRPLVALVHNVVGTLHAAMAIYDAYAGRAPMIIMSGTGPMSLQGRRPWIDWVHTALVQGNLVRDYVKWDDQPHDPLSVPESFMRAYRVAMTEPKGPVYITLDAGWQEAKLDNPIPIPDVSLFDPPTRMMADPDALRRVAQMLNDAELPLIVAGRVGKNRDAVGALVELAEAGGIPVVDAGGSLNFPNTNHLDATDTDLLLKADFILLLETDQAENVLVDRNRYTRETWSRIQENAKVASIGTSEVWIRSTIMDFGKLYPKEISILGDTSLAIPQLDGGPERSDGGRSGLRGSQGQPDCHGRSVPSGSAGVLERGARCRVRGFGDQPRAHLGGAMEAHREGQVGVRRRLDWLAAPHLDHGQARLRHGSGRRRCPRHEPPQVRRLRARREAGGRVRRLLQWRR